jgi:hypothetical protein
MISSTVFTEGQILHCICGGIDIALYLRRDRYCKLLDIVKDNCIIQFLLYFTITDFPDSWIEEYVGRTTSQATLLSQYTPFLYCRFLRY